jgi:predicted CoA-binding protein
MAEKIKASFFEADKVVFVGYSRKHAAFCTAVRKAFEARGTTVYPVNPGSGTYDVAVYPGIAEVPASPDLAYVLTGKAITEGILEQLAAKGIKRVLFNSGMSADKGTVSRAAALGMESATACPLMALGGGFHRFHGFLAGVPKVRKYDSMQTRP